LLKLSDHWRSATTRLIFIYGAFFVLWSVLLIGAVYWETNSYLERIVDEIVVQRADYLESIERTKLPAALEATGALDLRGVMSLGLFDRDGHRLEGNLERLPEDLPVDGLIHALPNGVQRSGNEQRQPARGIAVRLSNGELLVLARDTRVIDQISTILRHALLWGLTLTIIPGLIGGFYLSRRPLRRVPNAFWSAASPSSSKNILRPSPIWRHAASLSGFSSGAGRDARPGRCRSPACRGAGISTAMRAI